MTGAPQGVATFQSGANVTVLAISNDGSYCRSADGGQTWTYTATYPNVIQLPLWWIQYEGVQNQLLVSAGSCRLFLSTDSGLTWTMKSMPCLSYAYSSAFSPTGNTIAVTDSNGWLYVSYVIPLFSVEDNWVFISSSLCFSVSRTLFVASLIDCSS